MTRWVQDECGQNPCAPGKDRILEVFLPFTTWDPARNMAGDILTITSLRASDSRGIFQGHIDYNLQDREGRFDVFSSLEVPELLTAWMGLPSLRDVKIGGSQTLEAEGEFQLADDNTPRLQMTGHVRCEAVRLREMPFDAVELAFSWQESRLFLRDLHLIRPDGKATGKAMIEWPLVRLELHSTLPVPVYRPFFVGQPLAVVLNDFSEREGAAVDVRLEGGFDLTNKFAWAYTGSGTVKNLDYKGVPVNSAGCKFTLNHHELDFYEGTVVFNYSKYILHKTFNGAAEGTAKVGRIRYDATVKLVEVEDVRGEIWAAPMVRFFAPKVADSLEQYRFHQPPDMKASGVVDVTPQGRTASRKRRVTSTPPANWLARKVAVRIASAGVPSALSARVVISALSAVTLKRAAPLSVAFSVEASDDRLKLASTGMSSPKPMPVPQSSPGAPIW